MNKDTLKLKKEIQRLDKKWTTIWLVMIFAYIMIGIIFAFTDHFYVAFMMFPGIAYSLLFLKDHRMDIQEQMRKIERLIELGKKIRELKEANQKLSEEICEIKKVNVKSVIKS